MWALGGGTRAHRRARKVSAVIWAKVAPKWLGFLKFVMLTGHAQPQDLAELIGLGAREAITKPVRVAAFFALLPLQRTDARHPGRHRLGELEYLGGPQDSWERSGCSVALAEDASNNQRTTRARGNPEFGDPFSRSGSLGG